MTYTYQLVTGFNGVQRSDGAMVPNTTGQARQNADWLAYQAWVVAGNTATPAPGPTAAQAAATLLQGGLSVTSTATSALNGTYPCDPTSQSYIQAEVTSILLNGTFADGTSSCVWADASGSPHTFTIAQFKTLASAIAAFVAGCSKYAAGVIATAPANTATIP